MPAAAGAAAQTPKSPTEASDPVVAEPGYLLGPDDVIEVDALGHPDFQNRVRIGLDGGIQLPYLGVVPAGNRTVDQLGAEIAKALDSGGYFAKPIVKVEVTGFAARNVTVLGEVGTPGIVPVGRAYRLSEIIARVGGVREDAADYVILTPQKGASKQLLLKDLATGDSSQDPMVAAGDKIYVPKAELIYVSGQVKTPGAFPLVSGMTLRMALSRAGGITDLGSEGQIKLTRAGKKVQRIGLDVKIEAGDVIVVGQRLF